MADELDLLLSKPSKGKPEQDELDLLLTAKDKGAKKTEDPGFWKSLKEGAQEAVTDLAVGTKKRIGGLASLLSPGFTAAEAIAEDPQYKALKQQDFATAQKTHPVATMVGQTLGTAAAMPMPNIVGGATLGAGVLGAGLRGAVNAGTYGAAAGIASDKNANLSPLEAAQKVGIPSAIAGGAVGITGGLINKGVQSLLKPITGADDMAAMTQVAKETGLKPTYGDLSQAPTAQSVENLMSSLPGGKMRQYTQESAKSIEPSIDKFTNMMAGKWADVPESSFNMEIKSLAKIAKDKANDLYGLAAISAKAENLKPNKGVLKDFLDEQIGIFKELPGKDAKRLTTELSDQLSHVENLTYDKILSNVKYLSNLAYKKYRQFEHGTALPDEFKVYYKLRDKYIDALDNPNASMNTKTALSQAKQFYKDEVSPFLDPNVQKYMGQEIAMDKFLKSYIGTAKAGNYAPILTKLPDEARQALRKDLLTFIREEATGINGTLDTDAFLRKMNQYSSLAPEIFQGQMPKLKAYTQLLSQMNPSERIGKTNALMGATLGGIGAAIGTAAVPSTAYFTIPAGAALWGYSRMSASEGGRKILTSLGGMTDRTDPYLKQMLTKRGMSYLYNIIKNAPNIYTKAATSSTINNALAAEHPSKENTNNSQY